MQYKRDQRNYEQDVDQSARHVEHGPTQDPCDQKNHKQNRENAHKPPKCPGKSSEVPLG